MTAPRIQTPRLILSPLVPADAAALFAYRGDPRVSRYQSFEPRTLDDARRFIDDLRNVEFDTPGTWFQLAIRLRDEGRLIGDLGLHFAADGSPQVEIGFSLAPSHQGRGFGTEAVNGLLGFLLGTRGKHRVFASVDPRNRPSLALLERVGMRREAHFRESVRFKGEWVDDVIFAVLASEWPGPDAPG